MGQPMGRDRKARFRFQESREDTDEKWDGKWDGKNGTEWYAPISHVGPLRPAGQVQ